MRNYIMKPKQKYFKYKNCHGENVSFEWMKNKDDPALNFS